MEILKFTALEFGFSLFCSLALTTVFNFFIVWFLVLIFTFSYSLTRHTIYSFRGSFRPQRKNRSRRGEK